MSVESKDILLKAAEDVQQGMWCKGSWFHDSGYGLSRVLEAAEEEVALLAASRRCAQGSLVLATRLLGGTEDDYLDAENAVDNRLMSHVGWWSGLIAYNDDSLPDDPFEAGQQLAELFRTTAEAL
jgi:hypothetical protein